MGWVEKDNGGNVTVHAPAAGTATSSRPPKAYLDTNLVSGLAKGDVHADERDALFRAIELMHEGAGRALVTSSVTKEEINRRQQHPSPPSRVSLGRPTHSKEGRIEPSAVHNLCRQDN